MLGRNGRSNVLMLTLLLGVACSLVLMDHTPSVQAQKADTPKAGGQSFMVANQQGQEIAFFDSKHNLLTVIDTPPRPHEIHLSPDKRTAYCPIFGDGDFFHNIHPGHEIYVIDVASRKLKNVIDVTPFQAPHSIAWDADGFMWVTCDKSNCVIVLDPKSGKVLGEVQTQSQGSHWILALADGKKAYTSNKFSPFLSVIDLKARKMIKKLPNPEGSEGIAFSHDQKKLYFVNHREWILQVVDTTKDEIVEHVRIEGVPPIPPFSVCSLYSTLTLEKFRVTFSVNRSSPLEPPVETEVTRTSCKLRVKYSRGFSPALRTMSFASSKCLPLKQASIRSGEARSM